ncbi:DMT family transporter [Kordiimonas sp. SCSIO 12603]|uniref:DMT family transporter n=1 Tax=Kordiimonas sp. SCSIO 12603 TaxID=2829596 RepID=UPI0021085A30|nr:DMT family transporter [Kordiimonas sp. SCSIO 12603]UTW58067.1 DMT family transporter [Kordiimonas sp. SCSIO 12603]
MTGKSIYMFAALFAGAVLPLQALINARLGTAVGGASSASAISFAVGTLGLMIFLAVTKMPNFNTAQLASLPWWAWIGGLLGAYFVATATMTAPVLGAASMVALVIGGQVVASLFLDHYGIMNEAQPINWQKASGALLLIIGVYMITRPTPTDIPGA